MGQPVTVIEKPSSRAGVVRYEINRNITGMGHEVYRAGQEIHAHTPAAQLAGRLFERGGIERVHANASVITITLADAGTDGIREIVEDLFKHYRPGVPVPTEADFT